MDGLVFGGSVKVDDTKGPDLTLNIEGVVARVN